MFFLTYKIFLGYGISTKGRLCLVEEFAFNVLVGFLGETMKTVEKNYMHLSPDYLRSAVDR